MEVRILDDGRPGLGVLLMAVVLPGSQANLKFRYRSRASLHILQIPYLLIAFGPWVRGAVLVFTSGLAYAGVAWKATFTMTTPIKSSSRQDPHFQQVPSCWTTDHILRRCLANSVQVFQGFGPRGVGGCGAGERWVRGGGWGAFVHHTAQRCFMLLEQKSLSPASIPIAMPNA